ncbi:hypothetical protein GHK68_00050 [Sinorhizobium meliloti]|uniref:hypothetical protein n=1 Tax=Rhizobium meliloti TaxID=382 RepID=UPI0012962FD7|nr:hypothetical protein [Sinorhizobium meliloti]MQW40779.1 hypothetical protein [Sinorhizobium meliloti]
MGNCMKRGKYMAENAEGPPQMGAGVLHQAAALLVEGRGRAEVAGLLGVEMDALSRHIGPLAGEKLPGGGLP